MISSLIILVNIEYFLETGTFRKGRIFNYGNKYQIDKKITII